VRLAATEKTPSKTLNVTATVESVMMGNTHPRGKGWVSTNWSSLSDLAYPMGNPVGMANLRDKQGWLNPITTTAPH